MVEETLKKIEEQLNCSICLGTYTDPKLLQCFHVYCQQCLVPLITSDQRGKPGVSCPNCRQVTPIPDRGVAGLQSAFHISFLLEIKQSLQKLDSPAASLEGAVGGEEAGTSMMESMMKQVMAKKALAQIEIRGKEISDQQTSTEESIHVAFKRLREVLDVRETKLIGQLDQVTQEKLKSLAAQKDQIETTLSQLSSVLFEHLEGEVLVKKADAVEQVVTPFPADILRPKAEANIAFSVSESATAVCENYGRLLATSDIVDPSKCHVTGKGLSIQKAGGKSLAILQAINTEDKPCEELLDKSLQGKIVSEMTGIEANCSVERRGLSQYEISYNPILKGRHHLHVTVQGQHVRGSPLGVAVQSQIQNLGTPILTIGGLKGPSGVAINHKGELVVAEAGGPCVSVFGYSGEKIGSFITGAPCVLFPGPLGVVTHASNILVADGLNYVRKYSEYAKCLEQIDFNIWHCRPTDLALGRYVYLYVLLKNSIAEIPDISKFYHHKSFLSWSEGSGEKEFKSPCGIACDSTGKVYVADTGNNRIQVFTTEGTFLRMFGKHGCGSGELDGPYGIAIDSNGMVYVSEDGNHRVSVFTLEGQFVTSFGRKGVGPGEFDGPRGLAVDENEVLYVCDYYNCRVQVF